MDAFSDEEEEIMDYDDDDYNDNNNYDSVSDNDDDDYLPDTMDDQPEKNFKVLKESDIKQCQEDDITEVSNILSIPRNAANILLRHYNWTVSQVLDNWFANEDEVRETVGLVATQEEEKGKEVSDMSCKVRKLTCNICFIRLRFGRFASAACGHRFCKTCWTKYVKVSIEDGAGCLSLRCPEPSCRVVVDQDLINSLKKLSDEYKAKYARFLLRSYVEQSRKRKIRWCPSPGCENAVEFTIGSGQNSQNFDVFCDCFYEFCWNCPVEEAHSPVDCETVAKWMKKNSNEAENVDWILAYTKPCPKCKNPIEKNKGCMHMTCRPPCGYHFCWLCLGAWKNHGNYYSCNTYKQATKTGEYKEENMKREMAKSVIERYAHYFERWAGNLTSKKKAQADMKKVKTDHIEKLSIIYKKPKSQLKGIEEAWLQIIECRRVLRWSYAYGYYIPEKEQAKKNLFEYLQGQAESGLERLHECAEEGLRPFVEDDDTAPEKFHDYYVNLINLTNVTKNYFENLVRGLQIGLEAVDTCQHKGSDKRTKEKKRT